MRKQILIVIAATVGAILTNSTLGASPVPPPTNAGPVKTPPPPRPTTTTAPASQPATAPAKTVTGISMEPGYQTNQPLPNPDPAAAGGQTFEIYIPHTAAKPNTRRPVLFLLGRSSSKNAVWFKSKNLAAWSEETGVIIIGVNELFVATPPVTTAPTVGKAYATEEDMDAYMALADSLPGVHPNVRLLIADETNLTDEMRLLAVAQRYPSKVAGFLIGPRLYEPYKDYPTIRLGPGAGVAIVNVTWEAYARANPKKPYVVGIDDPFDNAKFETAIGDGFRMSRTPLDYIDTDDYLTVKPDKLHAALNWLLDEAWIARIGVNKDELAAAREDLKTQLKQAADQPDPATREVKLRELLLLPNVAAADGKDYVTPWCKSVLDAADTRTEIIFKDIYLKKMAALPLMKDSPEAKLLAAKLTALEADPHAKLEIEGEKKVRELAAKVGEIGNQQNTLGDAVKLQADFTQVTVDYPNTLAAREAKDWADILDRRIKNTNARTGRPKTH